MQKTYVQSRSGRTVRRAVRKVTRKAFLGRALLHAVMIAFVMFMALPLIYVAVTAFKPIDELFRFPPRFFVRRPTWNNFINLFAAMEGDEVPFLRYVFNSVLVTFGAAVLTVLVSAMGAYGLVKHKPPGHRFVSGLIVASLMMVPQAITVSSFQIVHYLRLTDTYWALILPKIAVALHFFLIQQFMGQVPDSFMESARLDGAGEIRVFFKIVMPTVRPAWATLFMYSFVATWNDYFSPLIFTSGEAMKTLPPALQSVAGGAANISIGRAGAVAAASFVLIMPTVVVFLILQRQVMETMAYTGIKS